MMLQPKIRLSMSGGLLFFILMLTLTSLLSIFGSIDWAYLPYWPVFMVSGLAAVYFGWWGIALAVLSPLATYYLGFAGEPFYLYIPISFLQIFALLGAFRLLRIDPQLKSWNSRWKYLAFAVAVPSFIGGSLAWYLRSFYPLLSDGSFLRYSLAWTGENLTPAIFPGIWLHSVIGDTYKTFSWESGAQPKSWLKQTLEFSSPWMLSLCLIGVMVILVVIQHVGWQEITAGSGPGAWKKIHDQVIVPIPALRLTALALSISLLYSLGSSIVLAKRSWVLVEAVRRYLPSRKLSDLILSGIEVPAQRCSMTIMISDILYFDEVAGTLSPDDLVVWLNSYFSHICEACGNAKGSVLNLFSSQTALAFGLDTSRNSAAEAINCALSIHETLPALNADLATRGLPPVSVGLSIHAGTVITGDLGSPNRRLFSAVGQTVDIASSILQALRALPSGVIPIVLSREAMREAGLLISPHDHNFLEFSMAFPGVDNPDALFAIMKGAVPTVRALLTASSERNSLGEAYGAKA